MKIVIFSWSLLLITACTNTPKVIVIQPLGNFYGIEAENVFNQIRTISSNTILRDNIPFPPDSYYKPRSRYKAEILLKYLKSTIGKDSVIIGLSHSDISTKKGDLEDWGVMGLGYRPGNACVVSDFRLSKRNRSEQFYKVALHELGHTQGLPHCKVKTCLMRDAEGGNPLDEEKQFCSSCAQYLRERDWKLVE